MTKNAQEPEPQVKAKLRALLPLYFTVYGQEYSGKLTTPLGKEVCVRPDFWCQPNEKLISLGWPDAPFAIEVKGYGLEDKKTRTACRMVYQAIVYVKTVFPTANGPTRPHMVLLYPPLSVILNNGWRVANPQEGYYDGIEMALTHFASLFRVGELVINDQYCEVRFWGRRHLDSVRGLYIGADPGQPTTRASR